VRSPSLCWILDRLHKILITLTRQEVAGLILESTFTSTYRIVTPISILPLDRFNNLSKIGLVRCPVLLLHGTQDDVIPLHHSETLYENTTAPKKLLKIEGADHTVTLIIGKYEL